MNNRQSPRLREGKEPIPKIDPILLAHAFSIARESKAAVVFVYADALSKDFELPEPELGKRIYYLTRTAEESNEQQELNHRCIQVPDVALPRMGQIKMAILFALAKGILKGGQRIVCLAGPTSSDNLDTIIVMDVGKEFELFLSTDQQNFTAQGVLPAVLERAINISVDLANEGREGKPVGALFVLGDTDRVFSMSRQLILNPFQGYPPDQRNILNPDLDETVKELATIDGAFLIGSDGVIASAGTYLKTGSTGEHELPLGLGARHQAAAAITSVSEATAITVSQSTGTVTMFRHGQIITEIERAHREHPAEAAKGSFND